MVNSQVPFIHGGAELLSNNLCAALKEHGHEVEAINIPFKWYPATDITKSMLSCKFMDLTEVNGIPNDIMVGLKFPAYYIKHPNKKLWILHQHRQAYDWWGTAMSDLFQDPEGESVRQMIIHSDQKVCQEAKFVSTISKNVSSRLKKYCGVDSVALYHPPTGADKIFCDSYGDFLFFPSRVNEIKRQELVLEALSKTKEPVRVVFAGKADRTEYIEKLFKKTQDLGLEKRVEWLGNVTEEKKRELYAKCLAVIYPPYDEDYGYVTLETMLSSKALITTTDVGGALEFVNNEEEGFIVSPNADELAKAFDQAWGDRVKMEKLGQNAFKKYQNMNITWENVIKALTC